MKYLFLMRHAKSSWDDPSLDDHDRPLNPRGFRQAPLMAERLNAWVLQPQTIVTSSAQRAKDTAVLVAQTLNDKPPIIVDTALYTEHSGAITTAAKQLDERQQTAMVIGHNPALNLYLQQMGMRKENLPTSGVAVVAFETTSWQAINEVDAQLIYLDWPKRQVS
ncbi:MULTISPECIES: SixA phosphatase family protein [Salinivibrio]|uniref:SixA phosphatase family protein n=1 Tax=Salinivibrio TaxID=51366 RepID=UPI000988F015|nr:MULTISPECIES: histidine phosphatase family protein [Salinivibrio]OOF09973.1 hypothetical protein BZG82_09025 [Salinivibrio sp. PR5]OOF30776.1 hypothetical protein BZJ20_08380 [Salinivibrio proteolyticus]